jgi:hypothetical protein
VRCETRSRVLVHMRLTLQPDGERGGGNPIARGRLVSAAVAVRLERRRVPMAFVSLTDGSAAAPVLRVAAVRKLAAKMAEP